MNYLRALVFTVTLTLVFVPLSYASVQLRCHRTANQDAPENTLDSLEQAALLGCNVVEIDLRRTLDGRIVLNHDGLLDRLTNGTGDVTTSYYDDLELRDAGSWMGERFTGLHMALFEDALHIAREYDLRIDLDFKEPGIGADVLRILKREDMLDRVHFGGEIADVKQLYPEGFITKDANVWVQPGITAEEVRKHHAEGKAVIVNFSANAHTMDLAGMKAAVAAGVDGINVDYPRLGADAVGRPVEQRIHDLILSANSGDVAARRNAILTLSRFQGFPLQNYFARWLLDPDATISRAASVALVDARPRTPNAVFDAAIHSPNPVARTNAAWALGALGAPASMLLPLLHDQDPKVLQATLFALVHMPGHVNSDVLLSLLHHKDESVRGTASLALARHQPEIAVKAITEQLRRELVTDKAIRAAIKGPKPTQADNEAILRQFRCQIEMTHALNMLKGNDATDALAELAFAPNQGFTQNGYVAGFNLWDRAATDTTPILLALASADTVAANRAEWILTKANPSILPRVRPLLNTTDPTLRSHAERILAWQGDTEVLPVLHKIASSGDPDAEVAHWAIQKIEMLHPLNAAR